MKHGSHPSQLFTTLMSLAFALPPSIIGCTFDYEKCEPQCDGRQCGPNGCGGSCGECGGSEVCTPAGACCEPDCAYKQCGDDGCGGRCGSCPAGQVCDQLYRCCEPDCESKECGSDGCGWLCGACGDGACEDGSCVSLDRHYPGPCEVLKDYFMDGAVDIRVVYSYDDNGRKMSKSYSYPGENGFTVDRVILWQYDLAGKLERYEEHSGDFAVLEYFENYEYNENGSLMSTLYTSFRDDPPRRGIVYHYYAADGSMIKEETDSDINGDIDEIRLYEYNEDGMIAKMEIDYEPDGFADVRWLYYYEIGSNGNLITTEDYYHPADGAIKVQYRSYYNKQDLIFSITRDVHGDGVVESSEYYGYNSNGDLTYFGEDFEFDGKVDQYSILLFDELHNMAGSLIFTAGGSVHYNNMKYSCFD